MAASESLLNELHDAAATELLRRIQEGDATAADIANALKMLKDNDITCAPSKGNALDDMKKALESSSSDGGALPDELADALEHVGSGLRLVK